MGASLALKRRQSLSPAADPNVIPFIDVLLVLLIIFMVTAPRPTVDLQLDLPRAGPPIEVIIPATIVEVRAAHGGGYRLEVGASEVGFEALAGAVLALILNGQPALSEADAHAEARVFVRAEQDVAYGHVVAVIDELQHAGFAKVAVFAQNADDS